MLDLGSNKLEVGTKKWFSRFPTTGLAETNIVHEGCRNCTKVEDHETCNGTGIQIPFGEHRHERIPEENTVTVEEMVQLRSALWKAHYIQNGVIKNVLYNMGDGANNVSQQLSYRIIGATGKTLTLRGRNPKYLNFANSIINPNYPGINPETGEPEPRLIGLEDNGVMPVGGSVIFKYPSVLVNKNEPWITKINPPESDDIDDVEFSIEVSNNISRARQPYDKKYPPGPNGYFCEVFFYFTAPEAHPNYQSNYDAQFSPSSVTLTKAQLVAASGVITLKNNDGANCRVIYPNMENIFGRKPLLITVTETDGQTYFIDGGIHQDKLNTEQLSLSWVTTFDASFFDSDNLETIKLDYWSESVSEDETRRVFLGNCLNSQRDFSESYIHDEATKRVCVNINCNKFDTFRGQCWQPDSNGFSLTSSKMKQTPVHDGSWWSKFWEDTSLTLNQGFPGVSSHRNWSYSRIGGPSLGELVGYHNNIIPGGKFPLKERAHYPSLGRRDIYETDDGDRQQTLPGLYVRSEEQDATNPIKTNGFCPSSIPGWTARLNDDGDLIQDELYYYPLGHIGATNLTNWKPMTGKLTARLKKTSFNEKRWIPSVFINQSEDEALTNEIREWLNV